MNLSPIQWEPAEWQAFCLDLLRLRHQSDLVPIPDRDRGDSGIEAFSRNGCAYQCYAPEEPLSVKDRYEKQRAKLTNDIGKFKRNSDMLHRLLGTTMISRWILLVPLHDSKELNVHASAKSEELRAAGLPYVAHDFQVHIQTAEDFPLERASLIGHNVGEVRLDDPEVTELMLTDWATTQTALMTTLNDKLARLSTVRTNQDRVTLARALLQYFLQGANILEQIRVAAPEVWQRLEEQKRGREQSLQIETFLSPYPANVLIGETQASFARILSDTAPAMRRHTEVLAWAAVADWLMRCPLDFPASRLST